VSIDTASSLQRGLERPATLSGKIQKYKIHEFEIEARGLQSVADAATA
jgi:hypothetical protein